MTQQKSILNDKNLSSEEKLETFKTMAEENSFLSDYSDYEKKEVYEQAEETLKNWPETTIQDLLSEHGIPNKINLAVNSQHGIYCGQIFFEAYKKHIQKFYKNKKGKYLEIKKDLKNPEQEGYFETSDNLINDFTPMYKGIKYQFIWNEGDIWELEFWGKK